MQDFQERQRVLRACVACRRSRRKCSGIHPCNNCDSRGEYCEYEPAKKRGPPPKLRSSSYTLSKDGYSAVTSTYGGGGFHPRSSSSTMLSAPDTMNMGGSPHFSSTNHHDYHSSLLNNHSYPSTSNYDTMVGCTSNEDNNNKGSPDLTGRKRNNINNNHSPSTAMNNNNNNNVDSSTTHHDDHHHHHHHHQSNRKRSRQQITVSTSSSSYSSRTTTGGGSDSPHQHITYTASSHMNPYASSYSFDPSSTTVNSTDLYSYYNDNGSNNDIITPEEEIYVHYYLQNSYLCLPVVDTVQLSNILKNGPVTEDYSSVRFLILTVIATGAGMQGYHDVMLHYYYMARDYLDFHNILTHPSQINISALLLLAILTNHMVHHQVGVVPSSSSSSVTTTDITITSVPIYINLAHSLANMVVEMNPSVRVSLSLLFITWSSVSFTTQHTLFFGGESMINSWKNPPVPKKLFILTKDNLLDRFTTLLWYTVVTLGNLDKIDTNSSSTVLSSSNGTVSSSIVWNDITAYLDELSTLSVSNNVFTHIPWNYLALQTRILAAVTTSTEQSLDLVTIEKMYNDLQNDTVQGTVPSSSTLLSVLLQHVYATLQNNPQSILHNAVLTKVRVYLSNCRNEDYGTSNSNSNNISVLETYTRLIGALTVPLKVTTDAETSEEISKASYEYSGTISSLDTEDDDQEPNDSTTNDVPVSKKRLLKDYSSKPNDDSTVFRLDNTLSSTLGSVAALFLLADASSDDENDQSSSTVPSTTSVVCTKDPLSEPSVNTTSSISSSSSMKKETFSLRPPNGSSDSSRSVSYERLPVDGLKKTMNHISSPKVRGSSPASSVISSKYTNTHLLQ